jgi:hypothetical protein
MYKSISLKLYVLKNRSKSLTYFAERRAVHSTASLHNHSDKRPTTEVLSSLAAEVARESLGIASSSAPTSPAVKMFSSASPASLSYNLGHIGAGSNAAIAAAASQAIAATQQVCRLCHLCCSL